MPETTAADAMPRPAAVVNAEIRRFTAGRLVWTAEALADLARLRAEWAEAVKLEADLAA